MKTFYYMAGLPRSGSTVLSSILNQNPRFYSGPSSPVLPLMYALDKNIKNNELFRNYPKPQQGKNIISSVIHNFYTDVESPIVIDKNRGWTNNIPFIQHYIGKDVKIICPVRDIDEILTSMIMMIRRNPYKEGQGKINFIDEMLIKKNILLNDYNRCKVVAAPDGVLGQSLKSISLVLKGGFGDCIHFVEYKDLIGNPEETLFKLYEFLGEEYYQHTFDNIENKIEQNDLNTYGLADMHQVHSKLESTAPHPSKILPKEILSYCIGKDFWRTFNK